MYRQLSDRVTLKRVLSWCAARLKNCFTSTMWKIVFLCVCTLWITEPSCYSKRFSRAPYMVQAIHCIRDRKRGIGNCRRPVKKSVYAHWCDDLADGMYIWDCTTFYRCVNETTEYLPCPGLLVANEKQMWCDYKDLVKPPCGTAPNCIDVIDGSYPDLDRNCQYFYTCQRGEFYGYTKCAASLMFNPEKNSCDWPWLVKPPCGTAQKLVWPEKGPERDHGHEIHK